MHIWHSRLTSGKRNAQRQALFRTASVVRKVERQVQRTLVRLKSMIQNTNENANKVPKRNFGLAQIPKTIGFRCSINRFGKLPWPK